MKYIKINKDTYIEFNEETMESKTIIVPELQDEIRRYTEELSQYPTQPTDEELLVWAKGNYPINENQKHIDYLNSIINRDKQILEEIS